MMETLGGLGGYGITSIIVIFIAFMLFAKFAKKIIGNIIMGGVLFWLLNTLGITPYELGYHERHHRCPLWHLRNIDPGHPGYS